MLHKDFMEFVNFGCLSNKEIKMKMETKTANSTFLGIFVLAFIFFGYQRMDIGRYILSKNIDDSSTIIDTKKGVILLKDLLNNNWPDSILFKIANNTINIKILKPIR